MGGFEIPTLRSQRLTLRALRAGDHPHLVAMSIDPDVIRDLHEGPPPSAGEVWGRMANALGQWGLRGYGMLVVEDADGFVGRLGIYHPYDEDDPQLSYILCRRGWGRGYATEGAALMRDWMFATHRPSRLTSQIARGNAASAAVATKLGAVRRGMIDRSGVVFDIWLHSVS